MHSGLIWQVDEFLGPLQGLVPADVELAEERQAPALPNWAGDEITGNPYFSSGLLAKLVQEGDESIETILQNAG